MNSIFCRTLKALCTLVVVGMFSAFGSSSTVDPFTPTRVIGLGDGFNDAAATVRETGSTTGTVVEQVAAYFGQSNVLSYAVGGARVADLGAQITAAGSFSANDLVVIAIGTFDVKAGATPATEAQTLVEQVRRLKSAGATHILIMPVLDVSRTPWGRTHPNLVSATATNTFNDAILTALSAEFGGQSENTVIYANASGVTSLFLTATSTTSYSPFTDTGFDGASATTPACGNPNAFAGCDASVPTGANRPYTTMLFADGIHLTPVGNRWVAQYLYNATGQGWR